MSRCYEDPSLRMRAKSWCQVGSFKTFDLSGRGNCDPVTGLYKTNTLDLVGRNISEKPSMAVDTRGKVTRQKVKTS